MMTDKINHISEFFFFERRGLVLISSMFSYTRSILPGTRKVTHEQGNSEILFQETHYL